MLETEITITLNDIHVGVWEGDDETPAIFFSFSKEQWDIDTLEWLDEDGDLIGYSESHLMHSHCGNELSADDIATIRSQLQEFLSAR
ncbi:hypothetical protein GFL58_30895 [Rhizobium leguminosarum bv. viciae]|uniref:hypothetical protein n=1 Tax=Rhizobium leguminosarum TaxID=384 RepID=UPI00143F94F9|nr:hypothetical protein [Rhizobium leguminosarum]NKM65326.1 hypothetical protein [Rhizobium leguminosarum bv. viciae]